MLTRNLSNVWPKEKYLQGKTIAMLTPLRSLGYMLWPKTRSWREKKKKKKIQKNWANFLQSQFTICNINRKEAHPSHEYGIAYP